MSADGQIIRKAFLEALSRLEHHDGISAMDTLDALDRLECRLDDLTDDLGRATVGILEERADLWREKCRQLEAERNKEKSRARKG